MALAPLAGLCFKRTPRDCAGLGFAAGFAFHGLVVYWIYNTCRFAHVPGPWASPAVQVASAAAVWAVLAGFLALEWAAAAAASGWLCARSPRALRPWAWALAWTAVSVAAERWTPRLAGDLPAYSQWRYLSLLQIGSIFGPHGLGWLVAAANACVAAAWLELDDGEPSGAAAANLAAVAALIAGAWMYGEWCLVSRPPAGSAARVEILQPDVDQYQKFDENFVERIRGNFIELLSRPRPENPSLVVWPESALPEWVDEGQPVAEAATWSRKLGSYQLVGVVSTDRTHNYNSAFLIGPDAKLRGVYHKRELVPFGEYVPLRFLERYISVLSLMGDLTKGEPRQPLMETPLGPMAVTICYEAMFPRWAQRDASRGARILANVTNDGWYKDTWGPYQHFQSNVYRAVENRVTVIRSGNTGISAVIDPWGVITAKLDLGVRGRLDAAVAAEDFFPRRSFYARHGDWFGTMVLWVTAFWAGFAFWRRPRAA
ncbi:MAG: apolipoprotein N-acyltransferase [Elusimicrobia bacterium]|nr:apolipoprotein N-acyltransferase [Elusimicrobiota bacterium]